MGLYIFVGIDIVKHATYAKIVQRIKDGQQFLDIGVGVGQDLRQLALDGAPSEHLHGYDVVEQFFEVGYKMFQDRDIFRPTFIAGDFFGSDGPAGLKAESYDIVHAGLFLHMFSYEEQVQALLAMLRLLKQDGKGSMVIGSFVGLREPRPYASPFRKGKVIDFLNVEGCWKLLEAVEEKSGLKLAKAMEASDVVEEAKFDFMFRFSLQVVEKKDI